MVQQKRIHTYKGFRYIFFETIKGVYERGLIWFHVRFKAYLTCFECHQKVLGIHIPCIAKNFTQCSI